MMCRAHTVAGRRMLNTLPLSYARLRSKDQLVLVVAH